MTTAITIVIPAYNEERRLPATLERLIDELAPIAERGVEIIVSDDGSTDGTVALVHDRAPDGVQLVSGEQNLGKGAALLAGAAMATNPLVVFLDADLPVPPGTLLAMAGLIDARPSIDMLVGSRRLPGSSFDPPQPMIRRAGGAVFRSSAHALGYRVTSDPQCGVKVLRRERLTPVLAALTCRGFAFDIELIVRARQAGLVIDEVPVAWSHVDGSSLRPFRDGVSTLVELARLRSRLGEMSPSASLTPTGE